ncbi:MAG: hypothetical protein A2252_09480 [Elusimicrobia bacterium RIFOXYA2_FULL_39_19]|nr:MAG: hypothetical protein A2252_09480 [Elusimicrobia bacterium RIFOXYA2_FULL_39_19]
MQMTGNSKKLKEEGQILPLLIMSTFILCMFLIVLINLGKLIKDRMVMQNAADNAAVSSAIMRARALNVLGTSNALLGLPGFNSGMGLGANVPDNISHVWVPCPGHGPLSWCDDKAVLAKNYIDGIVALQNSIRSTYGGGTNSIVAEKIAQRQELNSKGESTGADSIFPMSTYSLNLERNKGDIWYYGSFNIHCPPFVEVGPIAVPPQIRGILARKSNRWLEQGDNFNKQKFTVIATKNEDSASNKGYPIGGKLFNVNKWFKTRAIASAGAYNNKGATFPTKDDSKWPLAALIKYVEAIDGCWEAHLVPVGSPSQH